MGRALVVDFWESHDVAVHVVEGPWSAWLSKIAGQPVEVVRATAPGGANDEAAVTLAFGRVRYPATTSW